MAFKDLLKSDAQNVLFNPNEFGETIIYTAKGELAKSIRARVNRFPLRISDYGGREYPQDMVEIYISSDATNGISDVTPGFDKVNLPVREGGEAVDLKVDRILAQFTGFWKLEAKR